MNTQAKRGKENPDARPHFEALLEWGLLPMARPDYSPMRPEEWHTVAVDEKPVAAEYVTPTFSRPIRQTKGLIVTAADILRGRGRV